MAKTQKPEMKVMRRLEAKVHEYDIMICPACGHEYVRGEKRGALSRHCPVCQGQYTQAEKACQEMDEYLTYLSEVKPATQEILSEVEHLIRLLAGGYYRSELRTAWRRLRDELKGT